VSGVIADFNPCGCGPGGSVRWKRSASVR
jgi:hypothetical protein